MSGIIPLSLSGSLAALLIALSSPLLRKISRTWRYYLWLLVILRLLIPFSPEISLVGVLFQQMEAQWAKQSEITDHQPERDLPEENRPQPAAGLGNAVPYEESGDAHAFTFLENNIWGVLWLSTALILFIRKIAGYARFLNTVKKENKIISDGQLSSDLKTICSAMGIKKTIPIYTNSFVKAPMLAGFLKPMILLSGRSVSRAERMLILRHELTHYQRMDFLYKWLVEIAVCLHWFNPLVYWVRRKVSQDCEFSCDEVVISRLKDSDRQIYGEALLNSIVIKNPADADVVSFSLKGDGKRMKERLDAIRKYHRQSKKLVLTAVILTSVLFCGTVFAGAYTAAAVEDADINRQAPGKGDRARPDTRPAGTVVYENVELRRKEGEDEFESITSMRTNHTDKKIVSCDRAMLAFDKEGNPLELDWWSRDGDYLSYHYLWRHAGFTREVLSGQTEDQTGGWKLNAKTDPQVQKVAYILFCDIEITFEDGTVWENPEYEKWLSTYEGRKTDPAVLANYYPYQEEITTN